MKVDRASAQQKKAEPERPRLWMTVRLEGELRCELKHASDIALAIDVSCSRQAECIGSNIGSRDWAAADHLGNQTRGA